MLVIKFQTECFHWYCFQIMLMHNFYFLGPAGKIGNQGVRGPVGYDGPAGPKGKRGEIGFMGVEGPTGKSF